MARWRSWLSREFHKLEVEGSNPSCAPNLKLNKMSKTKFNGFEKYFIQTALRHAIEEAETDVLATKSEGKRSLYAPGYFTLVGNEIIDKVNGMTLKKYQD
jgi:hypothetical protein